MLGNNNSASLFWCSFIILPIIPGNYSINKFALQVAKSCFVPALFGHAIDDDFIQPHHSDRIYEAYVVSSVLVNEEHLKQYVYA